MGYQNSLKGFSFDRATTLKFVNNEKSDIDQVFEVADAIYNYLYERDLDEQDLANQLAEIEHMKATEEAIKMQPASNAIKSDLSEMTTEDFVDHVVKSGVN